MGADFIRSTAAPHTKQWSAEYQHASDDLFSQDCISAGRSFIVSPDPRYDVEEHEPLHIRIDRRPAPLWFFDHGILEFTTETFQIIEIVMDEEVESK